MSDKQEENIIKEVRAKYGLSYTQLAEITGAKESTLKNSASTGEVSDIVKKTIEWYMIAKEREEELNNTEYLKVALNKFLSK